MQGDEQTEVTKLTGKWCSFEDDSKRISVTTGAQHLMFKFSTRWRQPGTRVLFWSYRFCTS